MKRLFAFIAVMALIFSLGTSAFANGVVELTNENNVTITQDIKNTQFLESALVVTDCENVVVNGKLENEGNGGAGATVNSSSSVTLNGEISSINSGTAVYASGTSEKPSSVEITGNVSSEDGGIGIYAFNSNVTADKSVSSEGEFAISVYASNNSEINVSGDVVRNGAGSSSSDCAAVYVLKNSTVNVAGNVSNKGDSSFGVLCDKSTVTVGGNVSSENDVGVAAFSSSVEIKGNVTSSGEFLEGIGVYADGESFVLISGDVIVDGNNAIAAVDIRDSTVVVEGTVSGPIQMAFDESFELVGNPQVYIGAISDPDLVFAPFANNIHYLIGTVQGSATDSDFSIDKDIIGYDEKVSDKYAFTKNAKLAGETITLTPNDSSKKLTVSGLPEGVTAVSLENGALALTFDESFKGGLQQLMFILKGPEPIYIPVQIKYVKTAEVELPEGADEGDVVACEVDGKAGITVTPALLSETDEHSVQLFIGDKEITDKDFSIVTNADGSISILLSSEYMLSLGTGNFKLRAVVDGVEILFTVEVKG